MVCYITWLEWCPTLEPAYSDELGNDFEARLQGLYNDKEGRMGPAVGHAMVGAIVSGGQEKRHRGRLVFT
jgi:hypothetical protein